MPRKISLPSLAAVCFVATLSAAQVTFNQTAVNSGDTGTSAVVSGDFNNDGILDIVSTNNTSLSFYKGIGGGAFDSPVNQSWAGPGGQAFAADFNGDGKLDLAVGAAGSGHGVSILLGNGDGTFRQGQILSSNGPDNSDYYIALADFNGDHKPDIAVSNSVGYMQIFLGQGNGTFKLSTTTQHGGGPIVAGDFNADGKQDVAVASGNDVYL